MRISHPSVIVLWLNSIVGRKRSVRHFKWVCMCACVCASMCLGVLGTFNICFICTQRVCVQVSLSGKIVRSLVWYTWIHLSFSSGSHAQERKKTIGLKTHCYVGSEVTVASIGCFQCASDLFAFKQTHTHSYTLVHRHNRLSEVVDVSLDSFTQTS